MIMRGIVASILLGLALRAAADEAAPVVAGDSAPDFALTSHTEATVKLTDYRDKHHVVLVFTRAHW